MTVRPSGSNVPPTNKNTAAVVVLFHREGPLIDRLQRVLIQVAEPIVVSNDGEDAGRLGALNGKRVTYLSNNENQGLAIALNQGIARALDQGYSWCLLLDQDTVVDDDLVSGLAEVWREYPKRNDIAILAPNYRNPVGHRLTYDSTPVWQLLKTAVTSGSIISLSSVRQVGGMREAFFIEGIDIEFCLRVRTAGMQLVASGKPLMTHGAGTTEERKLFGRRVIVTNHSPWRFFMQCKNLSWITCRYFSREPRWGASALVSMIKRCCIVLVFESQRRGKMWALLRGVFVGFTQAMRADGEQADSLKKDTNVIC